VTPRTVTDWASLAGCAALLWGAMALVGCPQAAPVVQPTASCVSSVLADALQGMTLEQIVAAAGPGCVVDAEEVITILLGSGSALVSTTKAGVEAKARRHP
jgi:hypothetical protein